MIYIIIRVNDVKIIPYGGNYMEVLTTKNHIEISNVSFNNGIISKIGYKDIDEKLMKDIGNSYFKIIILKGN